MDKRKVTRQEAEARMALGEAFIDATGVDDAEPVFIEIDPSEYYPDFLKLQPRHG